MSFINPPCTKLTVTSLGMLRTQQPTFQGEETNCVRRTCAQSAHFKSIIWQVWMRPPHKKRKCAPFMFWSSSSYPLNPAPWRIFMVLIFLAEAWKSIISFALNSSRGISFLIQSVADFIFHPGLSFLTKTVLFAVIFSNALHCGDRALQYSIST